MLPRPPLLKPSPDRNPVPWVTIRDNRKQTEIFEVFSPEAERGVTLLVALFLCLLYTAVPKAFWSPDDQKGAASVAYKYYSLGTSTHDAMVTYCQGAKTVTLQLHRHSEALPQYGVSLQRCSGLK